MSSKGFEYGSTIYLDLFEALKLAAILTKWAMVTLRLYLLKYMHKKVIALASLSVSN